MNTENITVDADFPGASVGALQIESDTIRFSPDLRGVGQWWFYWGFRVRGAAGKTLRFQGVEDDSVTPLPSNKPIASANGPAFSTDQGRSWQWLDSATRAGLRAGGRTGAASRHDGFEFAFAPDEDEVWFSFGMVYTQRDWAAFLDSIGESPRLRRTCLAERGEWRLEGVRIGDFDREPERRVLVVARHHACEMMASYVMEGMVDALLNDASGERVSAATEFLFVPFMDMEGVARGEQGKFRLPHDHNRDYGLPPSDGETDSGASLYWEVAAVRHTARVWGRGKLDAVLDLHYPWARNGRNERVFQVLNENDSEQKKFGAILRQVQGDDGLDYRGADDIPAGVEWNILEPGAGLTCTRYMANVMRVSLATVFEIPYSLANGRDVTRDSARAFGRDLVRALANWSAEQ